MVDRRLPTDQSLAQEEPLTFTVNFPAALLRQAKKFRQQHSTQSKAHSVYINTLAVYAVSFYCDCLGIETNLPDSRSSNPTTQAKTDTAELITEKGALECRPISPGDKTCYIPPQIGASTLGCVAVEVDIGRNQATLLGFTSVTREGQIPLQSLQPLEALIDRLIDAEPALVPKPAQLSRWLENIFEDGWQPPSAILAASYRSLSEEKATALEADKYRAKALIVGSHTLALVVQVNRASSGLEILLSVYPSLERILPAGLTLELLNDHFEVTMIMTAGESNNHLTMTFQINPDETFSVRIAVDGKSATERFIS